MLVLGIESSCDETGLALYDGARGLIAHHVYSQVEIHARYGGVVPELASRDHVRKTLPLMRQLMAEADIERQSLGAVAVTLGPGLAGALLVGRCIGAGLAWSMGLPLVPVHHMEAHLLAPLLEAQPPPFPFLALLVSGGHTLLVAVDGVGSYRILGQSLDDAAGEAFDKVAKLIGLPYPGGPALARLAEQGDPHRFRFPRPMTDRPGLDFSFSGLKTFAVNTWHKEGPMSRNAADIARAFEAAVVDTMVIKCRRALEQTGLSRLVVAGGVGANLRLRNDLRSLMERIGGQVYYPRLEFCTDNGAMIALTGYLRRADAISASNALAVRPRWSLESLQPPGSASIA